MLLRSVSTHNDERALLDRAAQWPDFPCLSDLSPDVLRVISVDEGVDFASALLFDRIVCSADHGPFIRQIERLRQRNLDTVPVLNATLAIAPGAFYVEHPETGADGQVMREVASRFRCRAELIPTFSLGTPAENGRIIYDWLAGRSDEDIILASLSKGGADVKMALAESGASHAFRRVAAWINVGGILEGSPMVSWLLARKLPSLLFRLLFWLRGQDFGFIRDLERRSGCPLDFELQAPEHLQIVHVVGFPLARHMSSNRARRWHRRLSPLGPNDAVTILADMCKLPGLILPVWGTDHYWQTGWDPRDLICTLLQYLGEKLGLFDGTEPAEMMTK